MKIHHINIISSNNEEAKKIYTETMGFEFHSEFINGVGKKFLFLISDGVLYEFIEDPTATNVGEVGHIAYVSNDIFADFEKYKAMGITRTDSVGNASFLFDKGMHFFFIDLPNGAGIEFCKH